jgi:hypothetical protein
MASHFECALRAFAGRAAAVAATLATLLLSATGDARAGAAPARASAGNADDIDTEDMFGFVEGSDIGRLGQQETEVDTTVRSGKNTGSYATAATELEYKYTAFSQFRIAAAATFAYYDIRGVAGLNDLAGAAAQSLSFDARFRLLDRDKAPVGLTLNVQPHWGFADETSGVQLNHFGWEAALLADRELVPGRLVGAANLLFDTDRTRLLPDGTVTQAPTIEFGAALAAQARRGLWLGAEMRYLRGYEGSALDVFSGQALYAGPTLYMRLGKQGWMSAVFDVQLWGSAVGVPGALDLVNFERYQARLRFGYDF